MEAGGGDFGTNQNVLVLLPSAFPTPGPFLDALSVGALCALLVAISPSRWEEIFFFLQ